MLQSQIILFLLDIFQNTSIRRYFNFYRNTLDWNIDQVKQYQLNQLKSIIEHAQKNVPYYKEALDAKNFNVKDLKKFDDIRHIPLLTREIIQKHKNKLVSLQYKKEDLERSSSSGTTGIPIEYYHNKDSLSAGIAAGYFAWSLSGWLPGDKTLHIWGNPTTVAYWNKRRSRLKRLLKNQTNLASTEFGSKQNLESIYKYVLSKKFSAIDGYTTSIYELAKLIEEHRYKTIQVENVFTTAENLLDYQKKVIEEFIGPVSDLYGCGEINGIAVQPMNENKYFVIDPHVFVEVEKSEKDFKHIIVTDLENKAMPFIRYKIGDLIDDIHEHDNSQKIKFSYFKKLLGRDSEIIELPNGKKILPVNIVGGTSFRKIGGILKHKVVWKKEEVVFYFEINNEFSFDKADNLLKSEFKGLNLPIRIEIVDRLLPDKNGKYKYFEKVI